MTAPLVIPRESGERIAGLLSEINRRRDIAYCESGLLNFIRMFWHILEPETPLVEGWTLEAICAHLEAVTAGQITRLLTNVSPGATKSLTTSVFWPAWEWGPMNMPHLRGIDFSYASHLTERDTGRFRDVVTSPLYQHMFGDRFRVTKAGEQKVANDKTGWKIPSSVGGVSTGERGDRVRLDDPHNVRQGESDAVRGSTVEWFGRSMSNRLNDMQKSAIVVTMQRIHENDVSGHILANDLGYVPLIIPAEWDEGRRYVNGFGWTDPRKVEGELFWPERFSKAIIARQKLELGPYAFCTPHESPVLMGDLSLKPIGTVQSGDAVIGFTTDTAATKQGEVCTRRKLVPTKVLSISKSVQKIVRITLDSGRVVRCTPDHKWYRGKDGGRRGKHDVRPLYLPAIVGRKLMRVCEPEIVPAADERQAGWLSGFFDGEGSVTLSKRHSGYRPTPIITFSQGADRNLPLCDKLEESLTALGFKFGCHRRQNEAGTPMHWYYLLSDGITTLQRFIHVVKPTKWRERMIEHALGAKFINRIEKVVSIEPDGEEVVYGLETTTGNYVVWGLASSNSAQYQQSPEPAGGGIIKREWWQVWDHKEALRQGLAMPVVAAGTKAPVPYPAFSYIVASLDTAYTQKDENDPSGCTVWGVWTDLYEVQRVMLITAWAEWLELNALVEKVAQTCRTYRVSRILIEAKASGLSVAQELRRRYLTVGHALALNPKTKDRGDFAVQLIDPKRMDKTSRTYAVQHLFSAGMIYAPDRDWSEKVISEMAMFPKGAHDDLHDTATMALSHLRTIGLLNLPDERKVDDDEASLYRRKLEPIYQV